MVRPFLNIVRKKGMKTIFMIVDDLWLYQYHKIQYDGLIKSVFKMISFIEEKQWEIIGLNTVVKNVEDNITSIKKYNKFSNKIYLYESRNNNVLIDSTMDFLMFYIPFTLVTVFIWNRVFYLLINYRISLYLRPYSFWFIIADLLIQNNIEFFTFLSFRSVNTMFSYDISSKLMNIVPVIFLFIVFSYVVYSYLFYYYKYGIMARYFLVNMYRFQSSYVLMIVTFGVRPFLKGVVHAMLYENW